MNESMDDFITNGLPEKAKLNTGDRHSFVSSKVGFRLGHTILTIRKLTGMMMNIELGLHPGIKNNIEATNYDRRLYGGFKFGMGLSK